MAERFRKRYREKTAPQYDEESYKKKLDPTRDESRAEKKKMQYYANLWYKEVLNTEQAFGKGTTVFTNTNLQYLVIFLGIILITLIVISSLVYNKFYDNEIFSKKFLALSTVVVTSVVTLTLNYFLLLSIPAKWINVILFIVTAAIFGYLNGQIKDLNSEEFSDVLDDTEKLTVAGLGIAAFSALMFGGIAAMSTPEENVMSLITEKNEREREANILKRIRKHQDEAIEHQRGLWDKAKLDQSQKGQVIDKALQLYLQNATKNQNKGSNNQNQGSNNQNQGSNNQNQGGGNS